VTRSEYERLKAAAKARYDADLSAIERVWILSSDNRASTPSRTPLHPPQVPPPVASSDKPQESPQPASDTRAVVPEVVERIIVNQSQRKRGSVDKAVREVVELGLNGCVFTSPVVIAAVQRNDPRVNRSSVSGALKRLAELGVLKVVEEGIGRRPTTYQKIE